MKILEICPFSSGICGVWSRVKQEAEEFSKLGHKVAVFSSNVEKGTNRLVNSQEQIGDVYVYRFDSEVNHMANLLSKNVIYFNFKKELQDFSPDLVITHLLHPHSFQALKVCKRLDIPVFIVSHASFNVKRNFLLDITTKIYSFVKVEHKLKNFDKVISITHWELPYLKKLNVPEEKITYIPNGLPENFFKQEESKELNKVLFLGRIAPIKNLEILMQAAKNLPKIKFSIVGMAEKEYLEKLQEITPKNVEFLPPVFKLDKKIKIIDEHKIFVLPSTREAMPQGLIEAMSRGKIAISSNTDGGKEIIKDKENGFLFEIGDAEHLTKLIKSNIRGKKEIKESAKRAAKKYSWKKLIKDYQKLID